MIGLELIALGAAVVLGLWANQYSNWNLPLLAVLLAAAIVGDLLAFDVPGHRLRASTSFLAIVTHWSQMNAFSPASSFLTSSWCFPQKEQRRDFI